MRKKTVTISFVTTPELATRLRQHAVEIERSASWVIGKALEQYFGIGDTAAKAKAAPLKKPSR